jgi:ElaB/YqjD/DUF883 family membrane-anchored ribosome-binding protein
MAKETKKAEEVLELSKEKFDQIASTVSDLHDNMKETTNKVAEESVELIKKYPVHSALGAGAIGFLAGYVISKITSSK